MANLLTETRANAAESTVRTEGRWAASRMRQFQRDGVRLDFADAARLLVAVEALPIRDQLWLGMDRGNAITHVALWTDITRTTSTQPGSIRHAHGI